MLKDLTKSLIGGSATFLSNFSYKTLNQKQHLQWDMDIYIRIIVFIYLKYHHFNNLLNKILKDGEILKNKDLNMRKQLQKQKIKLN